MRWATEEYPSDYFRKYPSIINGLGELWDRFQWNGPHKPPENQMTHCEFLEILIRMREGINPKDDLYPSSEAIAAARNRYERNLAQGCVETPVLLPDDVTRMSQKAIRRSQRLRSKVGLLSSNLWTST